MSKLEETKETYEAHSGFDQTTIASKYDDLAGSYEEVYTSVGWPDPEQTAQMTIDHGYTAESHVLDMACGTGMVAVHLKEKTSIVNNNIVGLDASDGMLEKAKGKSLYSELKNTMLCRTEEFKQNFPGYENKFDFVTASGLLAEGHATNDIYDEMLFSLKVGGYAIFTSRVEYLESLNY